MEKIEKEYTSNMSDPYNIKLNGAEYEITINRKNADTTEISIRFLYGTFIKELTNANLKANNISPKFDT